MEQDTTSLYRIRRSTLEDTDDIVHIVTTAFNKGESWTDESKHVTSARTNAKRTIDDINSPKNVIFILEETKSNKKIATIQATIMDTVFWVKGIEEHFNNKKIIFVSLVAVLPEYQSKGIGKLLMNFIDRYLQLIKYYVTNNMKMDDKLEKAKNILDVYIIDFDNDEFVNKNVEEWKEIERSVVQFNGERVALEKFYDKLNYIDTKYQVACSTLAHWGVTYNQDFYWKLSDKLFNLNI